MPNTHILTKDKYLYPFIELCHEKQEAPTQLAIDKQISYASTHNPTIIAGDDKLVVHGTELDHFQRNDLMRSLYFIGQRWVIKTKWEYNKAHCIIGVNSEGIVRIVVPNMKVTPIEVFILNNQVYKFDWFKFGVHVPGCIVAKTQLEEIDKLNEQVLKLQHELQEKVCEVDERVTQFRQLEKQVHEQNDALANLRLLKQYYSTTLKEIEEEDKELMLKQITFEHKMLEKDEKMGKRHGEVAELKQELSNLRLELRVKDEKIGKSHEEVEELKQEQSYLRLVLRAKDEKIGENHDKVEELKQKLNNLRLELQAKNEKIGKSHGEVEELKQELSNLRLELQTKDIQIENQKFRNAKLNEEVTWLREKVASLGRQVKSNNSWVFILQFVFLIFYMYATLTR